MARFFRPLYRESLVQQWLPALDGVVPKLENGIRVLDIGCGQGLSTVLMGDAFPESSFVGIDPDEGSIAKARQSAERAGVDNVTFRAEAVGDMAGQEWDLVCFFDAFHHIGDPQQAARRVHDSLHTDGRLMLVEPRSTDSIEDNLLAAGPLYYSPSTIVCLPDALSQTGGLALGAQAGPTRLMGILSDGGFSKARVAESTDFNLIIEARP